MKLQHLAIGARFQYEGRIFVKTGPLTASSEQGQTQMIPRHAVLQAVDQPATPAASGKAGAPLDADKVAQAFAAFYQQCASWVPAEKQLALAQARETFFAACR